MSPSRRMGRRGAVQWLCSFVSVTGVVTWLLRWPGLSYIPTSSRRTSPRLTGSRALPTSLLQSPVDIVLEKQPEWSLEEHGFKLLRLPLSNAKDLALQAGTEMAMIAKGWRPIKNGDGCRTRCQTYLRMRKEKERHAPLTVSATTVLDAAERAAKLACEGKYRSAEMRLNDCVAIADFSASMTRQELHRDICRDAVECSTHGLLVPLSHGVRLQAVPGSHAPRSELRGTFSKSEVTVLNVEPGFVLLWDGMLVHAGDGAERGTEDGKPNRIRLHGYLEYVDEPRPFDDQGDREITEI
eukprot:TRINITY_DN67869_c0_g1_i1.p1 TRINITY_DN67869_c0_g1~~TRINITY_DN67869_c0_g1_i1.p1  ORF type:complete len:317 (+),score=44.57 TRINITY_DN67869_c0_g1_i1:62-952(+)